MVEDSNNKGLVEFGEGSKGLNMGAENELSVTLEKYDMSRLKCGVVTSKKYDMSRIRV